MKHGCGRVRNGVAASNSKAKRRKKACYRALRLGGGGGAPRGLRRGVGAGPLERAAAAVGAWEIGVEKGGVVVLGVQSMGDRERGRRWVCEISTVAISTVAAKQ